MNRLSRIVLAGGIVALAVLPACSLLGEKTTPERVPYSTFQKYLETNQVKEASVGPDQIEATLSNGQTIVTTRVPADIAAELGRRGVQFSGKAGLESGSLNWLVWLVPIMMMVPVLLLMRGGAGAGMGPAAAMTKSKARVFAETDTKTTFADIAGVDEAKEELNEIVAFLKDPTRLRPARRACSPRRAAGRSAGNWQDLAGARSRGRSRRSVLVDQWLGICRTLCRRRRRTGA